MDIVTILTENPELVAVLAVVLRLARAWQTDLTWPEYRTIHRAKRGLFPLVFRVTNGRLHLINEKGGREDPEYTDTVAMSVRETAADLQRAGASLHLLCSIKRRPDTHGDPLTDAHVIWTIEDAGEQVEAYLFANDDGTTDCYVHTEASTDDPLAHLGGTQVNGDKYGVLPEEYGKSRE